MPTQPVRGPARGHVCWGYRRRAEFVARARDFLAAGLAAGERVLYVAPGDEAFLTAQLRETGQFDAGLRRGAVQVSPVGSTYSTGTVADPAGQVRLYAAATEEALAAGFTGLRVAADATSLVRTPAQLDAFARYEHLVDRYMAAHPMSAMCGYDMHSVARAGATPFHPHGHARAGNVAAPAGELGSAVRELWPVPGPIAIDAHRLGFIDHRSLFDVAGYAERHDTTVVLRTRLTTPARLLELFDLTGVRVERAS